MIATNLLATGGLSGNGAGTRPGSALSGRVGVANLNVRYAEASHAVWVRRLRFFGTGTVLSITPTAGAVTFSTPGYTAPTAQVETATAAGTITTAGTASVTVTSAAFAAPVVVSFSVALSDTAAAWAAKARAALTANATVAAAFTVGGSSTAIVLTRIVDDYGYANDSTLNMALADVTSAGITEAATSANTTSGAVASGALVDEVDDVDAEGLPLAHFADGARAILVQGVRGTVLLDDSTSFKATVYEGGFVQSAQPVGEDLQAFSGMDLDFTNPGGVAEVLVVLVTAGA